MKWIAAAGLLALATSQGALANEALLKANNCMACHAVATRMIGPAYKDVAAKYKGQKDAEATLALKIRKGSSGVWGPIPMPPNPQVSEADAATIAKWVLQQK